MPYKVLLPQDISRGGKDYLTERGYELIPGNGSVIDLAAASECDAILLRTAIVNRAVLDAAKKLKVIGRYGVGLDNIDLDCCREKNVRVTSAPVANILSVAEYTILMILQIAKNTYAAERVWRFGPHDFNSRNTHCGIELEGRVLGVVGMGKIGRLVAKKAMHGLGMKIIAMDPYVAPVALGEYDFASSLDELLPQVDVLTLHVPLTQETRRMFGAEHLALMKPTAYLINAARGEIIDEQALITALKNKTIAGAALDVFENEPNVHPNPLFEMDNVIVSPHTAGMTRESADRVGIHAAMGIDDVLSGREPQWPVV